jgi:hypothetical protein
MKTYDKHMFIIWEMEMKIKMKIEIRGCGGEIDCT